MIWAAFFSKSWAEFVLGHQPLAGGDGDAGVGRLREPSSSMFFGRDRLLEPEGVVGFEVVGDLGLRCTWLADRGLPMPTSRLLPTVFLMLSKILAARSISTVGCPWVWDRMAGTDQSCRRCCPLQAAAPQPLLRLRDSPGTRLQAYRHRRGASRGTCRRAGCRWADWRPFPAMSQRAHGLSRL